MESGNRWCWDGEPPPGSTPPKNRRPRSWKVPGSCPHQGTVRWLETCADDHLSYYLVSFIQREMSFVPGNGCDQYVLLNHTDFCSNHRRPYLKLNLPLPKHCTPPRPRNDICFICMPCPLIASFLGPAEQFRNNTTQMQICGETSLLDT